MIDFSIYINYIGMFLTYGILRNIPGLKNISDSMLGCFSSSFSTVSRCVFVSV